MQLTIIYIYIKLTYTYMQLTNKPKRLRHFTEAAQPHSLRSESEDFISVSFQIKNITIVLTISLRFGTKRKSVWFINSSGIPFGS